MTQPDKLFDAVERLARRNPKFATQKEKIIKEVSKSKTALEKAELKLQKTSVALENAAAAHEKASKDLERAQVNSERSIGTIGGALFRSFSGKKLENARIFAREVGNEACLEIITALPDPDIYDLARKYDPHKPKIDAMSVTIVKTHLIRLVASEVEPTPRPRPERPPRSRNGG